MITDQDIEKLKTVFATKGELSDVKVKLIVLQKSLEQKIERSTQQIIQEIIQYIGEIMTVANKKINEHSSRINLLEKDYHSLKPYKTMTDDHEVRITKVETALDI